MSLLDHFRPAAPPEPTPITSPTRAPTEPILAPPSGATSQDPAPPRAIRIVRNEALNDLKARVHEQLIHDLDPEQLVGDLSFTSPARRAVEQAAEEAIAAADGAVGRQERLRLASEIADEVLGYGPLEPL
ncbi:MAG: hypothetical protein JOZ87_28280, partial [Chloroflexi bacterium]|nr:hypothetical protein [Chloroflexota bacterium]